VCVRLFVSEHVLARGLCATGFCISIDIAMTNKRKSSKVHHIAM
jgi:hypothetical protein